MNERQPTNDLIIGTIQEVKALFYDLADRFGTKFALAILTNGALYYNIDAGKLDPLIGSYIMGGVAAFYFTFDHMKHKTKETG